MKVNPFDLLADLDGTDAASANATASPTVRLKTPQRPKAATKLDGKADARSASPASPPAPAHKATLYVHDNSNQRACCLTVPAASLATTRTLAKFLKNKGFAAPRASLLTVHEDRVPCDLHVIPMDAASPILHARTLPADVILHLFVIHDSAADSLLQSFANVHPDCYKTLAECAEQPMLQTPYGHVPIDFQAYLESAFRASVASNLILYNDCDKTNLKAEWCAWNTGLVWKHHAASANADAHSGFIYLFFKRSLSRTTKERLASFSVDCPRQAKPWTMNKPKPVSDVAQWLNGAAVPPPPPAHLLAAFASCQPATPRPVDVLRRRSLDESAHPTTPTISEASMGQPSDLASDCSSVSHTMEPVASPTHLAAASAAAALPLACSLPALRTPDSGSKQQQALQGKQRRSRRKRSSNLGRGSGSPASSSPGEPSTPTQVDLQKHKQMEADIDGLACALQHACSTSALKTCGWISSIHDPAATTAAAGASSSAWAGQLRWVL